MMHRGVCINDVEGSWPDMKKVEIERFKVDSQPFGNRSTLRFNVDVWIQVDGHQVVWFPEFSSDVEIMPAVAATQAQKPRLLKLLRLNSHFVREASPEHILLEIIEIEDPRLVSVDSPFFEIVGDLYI